MFLDSDTPINKQLLKLIGCNSFKKVYSPHLWLGAGDQL